MLRLLCQAAFGLETDGKDHRCEQRLINCARTLNGKGRQLIPSDALRKLRLLLEDFPNIHHVIALPPIHNNPRNSKTK